MYLHVIVLHKDIVLGIRISKCTLSMLKDSDAIKEQPRLFILLLKHPACGGSVGGKMFTFFCKTARSHSNQLGCL